MHRSEDFWRVSGRVAVAEWRGHDTNLKGWACLADVSSVGTATTGGRLLLMDFLECEVVSGVSGGLLGFVGGLLGEEGVSGVLFAVVGVFLVCCLPFRGLTVSCAVEGRSWMGTG